MEGLPLGISIMSQRQPTIGHLESNGMGMAHRLGINPTPNLMTAGATHDRAGDRI